MNELMLLGMRVKQLRLKNGLTLSDVADKCGYADKSTISRIESGAVDLSLTRLRTLAEALGTTAADLMGINESPQEKLELEQVLNYATKICRLSKPNQIAVESLIDALAANAKA